MFLAPFISLSNFHPQFEHYVMFSMLKIVHYLEQVVVLEVIHYVTAVSTRLGRILLGDQPDQGFMESAFGDESPSEHVM